jgi:predicted nucleic acid-binding protein
MSSIVVADAGPLHYLVLIDCAEILPALFERVLVPVAIRDELVHPRAPQKVKAWILQPHPWLEVMPVTRTLPVQGLHKGETEALQLALERRTNAVLMDDMDGRAAARRLGIQTIFTVAMLELAAEKNLIELPTAIARLRQTSFFVSEEILDAALERDRRRRAQKK